MDEKKTVIIISVVLGLSVIIGIVGWRSASKAHADLKALEESVGGRQAAGQKDADQARAKMLKRLEAKLVELDGKIDKAARGVESLENTRGNTAKLAEDLSKAALAKIDDKAKVLGDKMDSGDRKGREEIEAAKEELTKEIKKEHAWVETYVKRKVNFGVE